MQTITIKIDDKIKDKFFWLLQSFKDKGVEIIDIDNTTSDTEYLKSIKGMEESILKASNEPLENYVIREDLDSVLTK